MEKCPQQSGAEPGEDTWTGFRAEGHKVKKEEKKEGCRLGVGGVVWRGHLSGDDCNDTS